MQSGSRHNQVGASALARTRTTPAPPANTLMIVLSQLRCVLDATRLPPRSKAGAGGVSTAQRRALLVVRARPGICVTALARCLGVRQPTASALVKALAVRKLLSARRCTRDRRTVQIHLLAAGRLHLELQPNVSPLASALDVLDVRSLLSLEVGLDALLHKLGVSTAHP